METLKPSENSGKPEKPDSPTSKKLWSGRFTQTTDKIAEAFLQSVSFDQELARADLAGSRAHVAMLGQQGIVSHAEAQEILDGLSQIEDEVKLGKFNWRPELEDVHMNIETRLTELKGRVGGKLHTGRSRNDQVATDFRLYVKEACHRAVSAVDGLRVAVLDQAKKAYDVNAVLPGYTHLQVAQPILLAHWWLAYFEMLSRDRARFTDAIARMDECPLGAGALAGTPWPIDREATARSLGFSRPTRNSLDSVASRDFAAEFLFCVAQSMIHLSRMAEDLIIYSSQEFGFVRLPDGFATGSSMMPQKKNPDVCELVRGKSGRTLGSLVTLLTVQKGLPLAYNKDLQEDKEPVFDTARTYIDCVEVTAAMLPALGWNLERMKLAARRGGSAATDLADDLAKRKDIPFREAHELAGRVSALASELGRELDELTLEDLRRMDSRFDERSLEVLQLDAVVSARKSSGGTARDMVQRALIEASARL